MPRVTVETQLPVGRPLSEALAEARIAACNQMAIQVIEQSTRPVNPIVLVPGENNLPKEAPSPNNDTVDRVLITTWDLIS